MNILKDFIMDMEYILEIYDDIEKTFLELSEDVNIYDVYNKRDIQLLIKVNRTCSNAYFRKVNKNLSYIDIPDLINFYNDFILSDELKVNPYYMLKTLYYKRDIWSNDGKTLIIKIKDEMTFLKDNKLI